MYQEALLLPDIFALDGNGDATHIGDSKYFKYVGEDTGNNAKPTTEYIRANINLKEPSFYSGNNATQLINSIKSNTNNNFTPTYVRTPDNNIYSPAFNWNLKSFDTKTAYNYGDVVFKDNDDTIHQMHSSVKGQWGSSTVRSRRLCFPCRSMVSGCLSNSATRMICLTIPMQTAFVPTWQARATNMACQSWLSMMTIQLMTSIKFTLSALMKGSFESTYQNGDYATNDVVQEGTQFWRWTSAPPSDYQHGNHN